ncbi:clavesin-2 isoform X2 [Daktulosphaira vitifoliae]|nr:clavesin-2 isoform X2 [Daktulosphaira vitifoliae]
MSSAEVAEAMVGGCWEKPDKSFDLSSTLDIMRLPRSVQVIAYNELRENEYTRNHALVEFKKWIADCRDIQDVNIDSNFLLRFLRVKKYSLPMAQQMLLKYLNFRQKFSMYFFKMDCLEPSINELVSDGFLFVSPFRDSHGRRVTITIGKNIDFQKYTKRDIACLHFMTYETLLRDEVNQVLGLTHFGDVANVSPSILSTFTPNEFARLVKWGEQSVPIRHKKIHILNVPSALKILYDFFKTRISEKLINRITMYNSLEELHKCIDKKVLPKEFGGIMPMAEMIELWKKELLASREALIVMDKMKILSDKNIITRKTRTEKTKSITNEIHLMNGSFRKLEVD